jgi:UDP-N-acetylglucosamine transferase subunit ALG13
LIFVTVGTQLPFDRLIEAVDRWADANGRNDVVAQVGNSSYRPRRIETRQFLEAAEFQALQRQAELLIAHCGIGSMVSALEAGQPILMLPRRASKGEHRNDHQWATAQGLKGLKGVHIAMDEEELLHFLNHPQLLSPAPPISAKAPPEFLTALRELLSGLER